MNHEEENWERLDAMLRQLDYEMGETGHGPQSSLTENPGVELTEADRAHFSDYVRRETARRQNSVAKASEPDKEDAP